MSYLENQDLPCEIFQTHLQVLPKRSKPTPVRRVESLKGYPRVQFPLLQISLRQDIRPKQGVPDVSVLFRGKSEGRTDRVLLLHGQRAKIQIWQHRPKVDFSLSSDGNGHVEHLELGEGMPFPAQQLANVLHRVVPRQVSCRIIHGERCEEPFGKGRRRLREEVQYEGFLCFRRVG